MTETVSTRLSADDCARAIRYVAGLFEASVEGGPIEFRLAVSPAFANPRLITQLGAQLPEIDELLKLRVTVAGNAPSTVHLDVSTPLYYFTTGLGLDKDCERSFAWTLKATLAAYESGGRVPTFPAPPRPPGQ